MLRRLNQFMNLDGPEKRLLLRAAARLLITETMLRVIGFTRYHKSIHRQNTPELEGNADTRALIEAVTLSVQRASRGLKVGQCLGRSLAAYQMLRARGVHVQLHIGVRKVKPEYQAHAWLEHRGEVVGETLAGDMAPFPRPIL